MSVFYNDDCNENGWIFSQFLLAWWPVIAYNYFVQKLILFCMYMILVVSCQGKIITVDSGGSVDFNNIQAVIDDSNDGDKITIQPIKNRKNIDIVD